MIYLKPSCDVPLHHDVPDGLLSLQLNVVFQEPGRDHDDKDDHDDHDEASVDVDDHDHNDHDDAVDEIIHLLSILSWQSFLSSAKLSFMFWN